MSYVPGNDGELRITASQRNKVKGVSSSHMVSQSEIFSLGNMEGIRSTWELGLDSPQAIGRESRLNGNRDSILIGIWSKGKYLFFCF